MYIMINEWLGCTAKIKSSYKLHYHVMLTIFKRIKYCSQKSISWTFMCDKNILQIVQFIDLSSPMPQQSILFSWLCKRFSENILGHRNCTYNGEPHQVLLTVAHTKYYFGPNHHALTRPSPGPHQALTRPSPCPHQAHTRPSPGAH